MNVRKRKKDKTLLLFAPAKKNKTEQEAVSREGWQFLKVWNVEQLLFQIHIGSIMGWSSTYKELLINQPQVLHPMLRVYVQGKKSNIIQFNVGCEIWDWNRETLTLHGALLTKIIPPSDIETVDKSIMINSMTHGRRTLQTNIFGVLYVFKCGIKDSRRED